MVSYSPLWELLTERKIKKTELMTGIGVSSKTLAKLFKNENVSIEVIDKICSYLDCEIGDVVKIQKKPTTN